MKASCLGKTLGTWRVWPAHQDVLKKWNSCVSFLFLFSPFFTRMEVPPGFAVKHRSPIPAYADKLPQWLPVWLPGHPPLWVRGTPGAVCRLQWNLCVQEWSPCPSLLYSSILQCTCCTLFKWELCFCSFLLSVVQWFTVVLKWFLCISMPRLSSHTLFISLFRLILYLRLLFFPLGVFTVIKFQFWRIL